MGTKVFEWDLKKKVEAGRKNLYPQQSLEFTFYTGAQKCFGSYTQKAN